MAGVIKTFMKTPIEYRRLFVDYDCWLEDSETLSGFQAVVTPNTYDAPLTISLAFPDAAKRKLQMYARGGKHNVSYIVELIVQTSLSQIKSDSIGIKVRV
jgi:hypothetical protein